MDDRKAGRVSRFSTTESVSLRMMAALFALAPLTLAAFAHADSPRASRSTKD